MQHSAGNSPTNTEPLPNSPKGDNPSDESVDTTILGTPISYKMLELNSVEGSDDAEKTVAVAMEDDEKEKPLVELFGRKRKASSEMQKKVVSPPKRHTFQLMPQEEGEGSKKRMKGDDRSEAVIQGLLDLNQEVEEEKESSEHDYEVQTIVVPFADLMENYVEPSVEEEGSEVESYASDEDDEVEPSVEEEEGSEVESYAADEDNEANPSTENSVENDVEDDEEETTEVKPSAENSVENEVDDDEEETTEVKPSAIVESEEEPHAEKDDEVKLCAIDTNEVEPCAAAKVEYDVGQPSGANKDEGESSHAAEKKAKGGFKFDLNELPPEEEDEN